MGSQRGVVREIVKWRLSCSGSAQIGDCTQVLNDNIADHRPELRTGRRLLTRRLAEAKRSGALDDALFAPRLREAFMPVALSIGPDETAKTCRRVWNLLRIVIHSPRCGSSGQWHGTPGQRAGGRGLAVKPVLSRYRGINHCRFKQ